MSAPVHTLLYVPNCIGYVRLLLLLAGLWCCSERPASFVLLYCCNLFLDLIDGMAARMLQQTSEFGAALDVVLDNVTRQALWIHVAPILAPLVCALEWCVFAFTTSERDGWKTRCFKHAPPFVTVVMRDNFRSLPGALVIGGLMFTPLNLYLHTHIHTLRLAALSVGGGALRDALATLLLSLLEAAASRPALWVLVAGRLWCMGCEMWVASAYLGAVLHSDAAKAKTKNGGATGKVQ